MGTTVWSNNEYSSIRAPSGRHFGRTINIVPSEPHQGDILVENKQVEKYEAISFSKRWPGKAGSEYQQ